MIECSSWIMKNPEERRVDYCNPEEKLQRQRLQDYERLTLRDSRISSLNLRPQMLVPPRPVPVGSPPWIINPFMFL